MGINIDPNGWKICIYQVVLMGGLNSDFGLFLNGLGLGPQQKLPAKSQRDPIDNPWRVLILLGITLGSSLPIMLPTRDSRPSCHAPKRPNILNLTRLNIKWVK